MSSTIPPLSVVELALKDILENLGIAPIVLANWRIEIKPNIATWGHRITLSWRDYQYAYYIDKDDMQLSNPPTAQLLIVGRSIASELYIFNAAKDEEHMEALMLLSMRPTNGIQN